MSRRLEKVLLGLTLVSAAVFGSEAQPEFRIERSFGALRIPVSELGALVANSEHLATNAPPGEEVTRQGELALSDGALRVETSGKYTREVLELGPKRATEASYSFYNPDSGVSRVSMELYNFRRQLVVEGTDRARVESLARFMAGELEKYETITTGFWAKLDLLMFVAILAAMTLIRWPAHKPLVLIGGMAATWFLFTTDSFLPSTSIFAGEPSWLARAAPQLTLAGFVVGAIALALQLVKAAGRGEGAPE